MRCLVVAAQKGGAGKTTITVNLACAAIGAGAGPIYVMDTDPQRTLTRRWLTPRTLDVPTLVEAPVADLAAHVTSLRNHPGVLLIDTPPALSGEIALTIEAADLVLVPVQASPPDLDAVGATVDLLEQSGKPFVFVVNRAQKRSKLVAPSIAELSQHGPVAPAIIHDWAALREGFINGTGIVESHPQSEAAQEIEGLWTYVDGKISVNKPIRRRRKVI